jgi:TetR/AcrR family transcriptional regulator, cholesterol catabolism regulator
MEVRRSMTRQGETGLRERRRQATRDALYDAAMELISRKGFADTSMEEIALRADVARATAFNHFPRKADFIQEWGARRRAWVEELVGRESLGDQGLAVLIQRYFSILAESHASRRETSRRVFEAWVESGGPIVDDPYLADLLVEHFRRSQVSGEVRPGVDPEVLAHMCRDIYFGILYLWVRGDAAPFDLAGRLRSALDVVLAGVLVAVPAASGGRAKDSPSW